VTTGPIHLPGGRKLLKSRRRWILQPDGITVDAEEVGELVRVTDPDTGKVLVEAARAEPPGGPQEPPTKPPASRAAAGQSGRWQTYNEFVDVIGPRLTLAEREIWHVMFRHARGGVVETTARRLATACQINKATVVRAQRGLEAVGLIWTIWKSVERSRSSKYGLHDRPAACLGKVLARRGPK